MKRHAGRVAEGLGRSGLLGLLERADRDRGRVRVLAYHRVGHPDAEPDLDPGLLSATPEEFREQVEMVSTHYHPVALDDVVAAHRGEHQLPPRAVLFTFDDGYRDVAEHAWPVLREFEVPAVMFVPTAYPDTPGPGFWWDRLHAALRRTTRPAIEIDGVGRLPLGDDTERRAAHRAIRARVKSMMHEPAMDWLDARLAELVDELPSVHRVLGWDELRTMARDGLAVCSHSHDHALSVGLDPAALADDLRLSKSIVERELADSAAGSVFAFPSGYSDRRTRAAVREAGYELAFAGPRRVAPVPFPEPYAIPRLPVMRYATALVRAQLRPGVAGLGRVLIDRHVRVPGRAAPG